MLNNTIFTKKNISLTLAVVCVFSLLTVSRVAALTVSSDHVVLDGTVVRTEPIDVNPDGLRTEPIDVNPDGLRTEPIDVNPDGLNFGLDF